MVFAFRIQEDVARVFLLILSYIAILALALNFKLIESRRDLYRTIVTMIVLLVFFILALFLKT